MFGNLNDVMFDVVVEPCYALNSKAKMFGKQDLSYVGTVLFDRRRNFSLRIERNSFKFISNRDLVIKAKELTEGSRLAWKIIYYNNDKTEFYLNAIILEWKGLIDSQGTLLKPALELSNFYTGRYNSRILFSIYHPLLDTFIRTPLPLHTEETVTHPLQRLHNELTQTYLPHFLDNKYSGDNMYVYFRNITFSSAITNSLPYRINQLIPKAINKVRDIYSKEHFPLKEYQLVALMIIAILAHEWSATNYEQARKFQHFMFERIMKIIPQMDSQILIRI